MNLFELKEVVIGYQHAPISAALNLHLPSQRIIALLGANGCGKTTLLKTLLRLIPALSGDITIAGRAQNQWHRRELAQFIGYVPQAQQAVFPFKVEEVVLFGRTAYLPWYRQPQQRDRDIARQCLQQLNIDALRHRTYSRLSGGERQLVLIARALAQQPRCLIMDEPTSSLDFGNQLRVLETIEQLKARGLSILFTTHQPEQARRIADQCVLFHQGAIIAQGKPAEVMTVHNLARIYQLAPAVLCKNLAFLSENKDEI